MIIVNLLATIIPWDFSINTPDFTFLCLDNVSGLLKNAHTEDGWGFFYHRQTNCKRQQEGDFPWSSDDDAKSRKIRAAAAAAEYYDALMCGFSFRFF